jgi:predicted KAP-like P-loop ATPase
MTEDDRKHPFSADRPITSAQEDLLGRTSFAESLASGISGWKGNDSLVVSLHGPWGSGKSSIKNMVLEALRRSDKVSPIILEFNPWQWAGHEELARAFFHEVGLALGRADTSKEEKTSNQVEVLRCLFTGHLISRERRSQARYYFARSNWCRWS